LVALIDSLGAQICWSEEGSGDPILLVMGHIYAKEMWHRTVPALARQHRVITFDNRGVGGTVAPQEPFSIATMALDAIAVLDAAGVERAHVFGVSMGGLIAQELAISHPARVRSLILGCTGAPSAETAPSSRWASLKYRIPLGLASRLTVPVMYGKGTPRQKIDEDLAIIASTRISSAGLAEQSRAVARYRSLDRVGGISIPTLVIHGTDDRVVSIDRGRELADRIVGARFVAIPGAGHNFMAEATEETNDLVLEFVEQVSRAESVVGTPL
jgi:pimeloyl-ACP methyl ester carboxylesterase